MIVQAVKNEHGWIIPNIPELYAQNIEYIFLDVQLIDSQVADNNQLWSEEYIQKNWKRIVSKSLAHLPEDYEKSDEYFEARAKYLMEKCE
jgi:hypothetical protein